MKNFDWLPATITAIVTGLGFIFTRFDKSDEKVRKDRDDYWEQKRELESENDKLKEKIKSLENEIEELKKGKNNETIN